MKKARVSLVKTSDRAFGVTKAIDLLEPDGIRGKQILLKPNFNTADPTPGSTHNDTLRQLIMELKNRDARKISIGERSYHLTEKVMEEKGIYSLAHDLGVNIINFDHLKPEDWVLIRPEHSHWKDGFRVARPILEAESVVTTCCLKTHRHGGFFTLSLKLSVGTLPIRGYPYMDELHSSVDQRKMIAELNQAYSPVLIVLDGIDAFVDGGPDKGTRKSGNVMLAGSDRVAIDAVGVAILKELGSNEAIMSKKIFQQEQIARAAEIGLGVNAPEMIEIITGDEESETYAKGIRLILAQG